jgi:type VI protein secretion system component VasK
MFRKVWIIAAVVLALCWAAYGIWTIIERRREKRRPKATTKRQQQARQSFEEYVKKMKEYKKPTYKRDDEKK